MFGRRDSDQWVQSVAVAFDRPPGLPGARLGRTIQNPSFSGGSIINGLGLTTGLMGFPMVVEGQGVGLLGAWQSLQEIIAMTLGWDGVGSPLGGEDAMASLASDIFGMSV